jgi:hypothetical protein
MTIVHRRFAALALAALGCGSSHATGPATLSSSIAQSVRSATSGGIGGRQVNVTLLSGPSGEDCRNHSLSPGAPGSESVGTLALDVDPATIAGKSFPLAEQFDAQHASLELFASGNSSTYYVSFGGTVSFSADTTSERIKGTIDAGVGRIDNPTPVPDEIAVQGSFDATPCGP